MGASCKGALGWSQAANRNRLSKKEMDAIVSINGAIYSCGSSLACQRHPGNWRGWKGGSTNTRSVQVSNQTRRRTTSSKLSRNANFITGVVCKKIFFLKCIQGSELLLTASHSTLIVSPFFSLLHRLSLLFSRAIKN